MLAHLEMIFIQSWELAFPSCDVIFEFANPRCLWRRALTWQAALLAGGSHELYHFIYHWPLRWSSGWKFL